MKLIKHLYKESGWLMIIACFLAIISGLSGTVVVKTISTGIRDGLDISVAPLFLATCGLLLLTRIGSQHCMTLLTQNATLKMRVELSKKLVATPYATIQQIGKPGLMAILTKDIDGFSRALEMAPIILTDVIIITSCIAYMAWLSWQLACALAIVLVAAMSIFILAQTIPRRQFEILRQRAETLYADFRNLVEGAREFQLNEKRAHEFVEKILWPHSRKYREAAIRGARGYSLVTSVGDLMFYLVIGLILLLAPAWLPQSKHALPGVALLLLYMMGPISNFVNFLPALAEASIALDRIQQLNGQLTEQYHNADVCGLENIDAPIVELCGLSRRYPSASGDRSFMLGPINVRIGPGEILFIAGGNGSGKTTLAMTLLGLYSPDSGEIRMNGQKITEHNIKSYRQKFSAIFYDYHLIEDLLGLGEANHRQVQHYIDRFGLTGQLSVSNGQFSTIDLSSGQRRRLALILAYLEDKQIYLFDEWAADQDPIFKRIFYSELLPELKSRGKTVIAISHDEEYFKHADRVLRLKDGLIHEVKPLSLV